MFQYTTRSFATSFAQKKGKDSDIVNCTLIFHSPGIMGSQPSPMLMGSRIGARIKNRRYSISMRSANKRSGAELPNTWHSKWPALNAPSSIYLGRINLRNAHPDNFQSKQASYNLLVLCIMIWEEWSAKRDPSFLYVFSTTLLILNIYCCAVLPYIERWEEWALTTKHKERK